MYCGLYTCIKISVMLRSDPQYISAVVYSMFLWHSLCSCRTMFVSAVGDASHDWSHSTLVVVCLFLVLK